MIGFFSAFESFFFKYVNFSGRASRAEFWWVMPVIWGAIAGLFYLDITGIWADLLAWQRPSLNPLAYTSVMVFLLTLLPRFSITARRLHDSGLSGKWVTLPYSALFLSVMAALGLASALLTSGGEGSLAAIGIVLVIFAAMRGSEASADTVWDAIHSAAAFVNSLDLGALWTAATADLPEPDFAAGAANLQQSFQTEPEMAFAALLIMGTLFLGPVISMCLYLIFMLLPSSSGENGYGHTSGPDISTLKSSDGGNPLAAYAVLFEKTEEEKQAMEIRRKEEIKQLYRQRVLGQQP